MHILEEVRTNNGLIKSKMAERLGIAKSYYSMIIKTDRPISKNVAIKLQTEFGIPLNDSLCPGVRGVETERHPQHKVTA